MGTFVKQTKKPIVAYNEVYGMKSYYLSSVADKLFINPMGVIDHKGMSATLMFYKGLLEKLNIDIQIFRLGKFKSAIEPLTLDKMSLFQILPIIANCDVAVCNDSSFSHLSAAISIPTIVLMADTPLLYGSYSSKMFPIIPDGEVTVKHDTLGKEKIDPQKIFYKFNELIN